MVRAQKAARRGPSMTCGCSTSTPRERRRCSPGSARSAAHSPTTTTRGAGRWRAIRRSAAGSARCTRAGSPIRASSPGRSSDTEAGRDPPPVRPRHRSAAHAGRTDRRVAARPRSTASRRQSSTGRAWPTCCRPEGLPHPNGTRRSTSRCSDPGRSITRAGRPWRSTRSGRCMTTRIRTRRSTTTSGSSTTSARDLSESRDLAQEHPELLAELIELWWEEARRNQVLPLDNRVLWALVNPKPDQRRPRDEYRVLPGRRSGT